MPRSCAIRHRLTRPRSSFFPPLPPREGGADTLLGRCGLVQQVNILRGFQTGHGLRRECRRARRELGMENSEVPERNRDGLFEHGCVQAYAEGAQMHLSNRKTGPDRGYEAGEVLQLRIVER